MAFQIDAKIMRLLAASWGKKMHMDAAKVVKELDEVTEQAEKAGGSRTGFLHAIGLYCSAISRFAPPSATYTMLMKEIWGEPIADRPAAFGEMMRAEKLLGIVRSLRDDYAAGRMQGLQELIHADLFSDFLAMAEYFLEEGHKDPAAVMAGGVLEEHLRKLCVKHTVATLSKPKLDTMNCELARVGAYGKNEQKSVTAWAGIRNDAAHAKYDAYSETQVREMLLGIRGFITRNPA